MLPQPDWLVPDWFVLPGAVKCRLRPPVLIGLQLHELVAMLTPRALIRGLLGGAYIVAGYFHLATPGPFVRVTPPWVPAPETVVTLTGLAEFAGALALVQPWSSALRRAAGMSLALYALCVWPANFQHFAIDQTSAGGGLGLGYHIPRLMMQPIIVWAALWTGEVTRWPFRRRWGERQ